MYVILFFVKRTIQCIQKQLIQDLIGHTDNSCQYLEAPELPEITEHNVPLLDSPVHYQSYDSATLKTLKLFY